MDRQYRHEREQHGSSKEHKHRRERTGVERPRDEKHRTSRHDAENLDSQHHEMSGVVSQHKRRSALNADDDYVRNWLDQADMTESLSNSHTRSRPQHSSNAIPSYMNHDQLPPDTGKLDGTPRKAKRKHNPSSDSSLLDEPRVFKSAHRKTRVQGREHEKAPLAASPPTKRQKVVEPATKISDVSTELPLPNEIFEKRPRHKTREDRYNSKKSEEKANKHEGNEPRKTKKEKKGGRSRSAKKGGGDLMQKFASKSIGQKRLTMRPFSGLGLFRNGRASSPAKRRGVPDLAFSEMDFLQHSRQAFVEKEDQTRSKSREKEKRKASRKRDEITTFFKPTRTPLEELHPNRQHRDYSRPTFSKERTPIFVSHRNEPPTPHDRLSRTTSEDHSLQAERTKHISRQAIPARPFSLAERASRNAPSDKDSYISWSETAGSPSGVSKLVDRHRNSQTPESIRRTIESTGIFRDTGILRRQSPGPSVEFSSPRLPEHPHNVPETHDQERRYQGREWRQPPREVIAKITYISSSRSSSSRSRSESTNFEEDNERNMISRDSRSGLELKTSRPETRESGRSEEAHRRLIVKHLVPETEWRERPNSAPNAESRKSQDQVTTIDREALAKKARIRRPATTLPIVRSSVPSHEQAPKPATHFQVDAQLPRNISVSQSAGFVLDQPDQTFVNRSMADNIAESGQFCAPKSTSRHDQRAFESVPFTRDAPLEPISIADQRVYPWTTTTSDPSSDTIANTDYRHGVQQLEVGVPYFSFSGRSYGLGARTSAFPQTRLNSIPEEEETLYHRQLQLTAGMDRPHDFGYPSEDFGWQGRNDMASNYQIHSGGDLDYYPEVSTAHGNQELETYPSDFDEEIGISHLTSNNALADDVDDKMSVNEGEDDEEYEEVLSNEEVEPMNAFNALGHDLQYQQDYEQDTIYSESFWGNRFIADRF